MYFLMKLFNNFNTLILSMPKKSVLITYIFCFLSFCLTGQRTGQRLPASSDNPQVTESTKGSGLKSKKIFYGEPGKAALYSLIIPGAGQLYNKRWWKVPFVYALEGSAVYLLINNLNTYSNWNNCYIDLVNNDIPSSFCDSFTKEDQSTAFRIRNSTRTNKELSFIFLGLAHLLNVVEAFVDRHLINFDTSDNLTYSVPNLQLDGQVTFISIKIPLNI